MRVALFFFAFTVLFAVVLPQLLGIFLQQDDQVTQQLREGADPTIILEETASGEFLPDCLEDGYEYRTTAQGVPYIRALNDRYVAVFIDNNPRLFELQENLNFAVPAAQKALDDAKKMKLFDILSSCIQSRAVAQPSTLQLKQ